MKTVICEICEAPIAKVDKPHSPISGDQLHSLIEGEASVFDDSLDWEWLKCPMCTFRPFMTDSEITILSDEQPRKPYKLKLYPKKKKRGRPSKNGR